MCDAVLGQPQFTFSQYDVHVVGVGVRFKRKVRLPNFFNNLIKTRA